MPDTPSEKVNRFRAHLPLYARHSAIAGSVLLGVGVVLRVALGTTAFALTNGLIAGGIFTLTVTLVVAAAIRVWRPGPHRSVNRLRILIAAAVIPVLGFSLGFYKAPEKRSWPDPMNAAQQERQDVYDYYASAEGGRRSQAWVDQHLCRGGPMIDVKFIVEASLQDAYGMTGQTGERVRTVDPGAAADRIREARSIPDEDLARALTRAQEQADRLVNDPSWTFREALNAVAEECPTGALNEADLTQWNSTLDSTVTMAVEVLPAMLPELPYAWQGPDGARTDRPSTPAPTPAPLETAPAHDPTTSCLDLTAGILERYATGLFDREEALTWINSDDHADFGELLDFVDEEVAAGRTAPADAGTLAGSVNYEWCIDGDVW